MEEVYSGPLRKVNLFMELYLLIKNIFKRKEYKPNNHGAIFKIKIKCGWFRILIWVDNKWKCALTDTVDTIRSRQFDYPPYRDICWKSFSRDEMLSITENYTAQQFIKEYITDVLCKVKQHNKDLDQKIKRIKDKL